MIKFSKNLSNRIIQNNKVNKFILFRWHKAIKDEDDLYSF